MRKEKEEFVNGSKENKVVWNGIGNVDVFILNLFHSLENFYIA